MKQLYETQIEERDADRICMQNARLGLFKKCHCALDSSLQLNRKCVHSKHVNFPSNILI
jgi:hypothetical protein